MELTLKEIEKLFFKDSNKFSSSPSLDNFLFWLEDKKNKIYNRKTNERK